MKRAINVGCAAVIFFAACSPRPMSDGGTDDVTVDVFDDAGLEAGAVDVTLDAIANDGAEPGARVIALVAGHDHSCALHMDGTVWCVGGNDYGELGVASMAKSARPQRVMRLVNVDRLPVRAMNHTCARRRDGTATCWGLNVAGQLGDGSAQVRLLPVAVAQLTTTEQLAIGGEHSCARRSSGSVVCWGLNASGQIGDATRLDRRLPVPVSGLDSAAEIAAGENFTCARRADHYVVCWGQNRFGQLGDLTLEDRVRPVRVSGLTDAIEIAAGGSHACARRMNGSVVCWGSAASGQLGGTAVAGDPLVTVVGLTDAVSLAAGEDFTCARRANGSVVCWGDNRFGQLGTGSILAQPMPGPSVLNIVDATQITAGFHHACALRADASVMCWGNNDHLQIGEATIGGASLTPRTIAF